MNRKSKKEQAQILRCLCEGNSIRGTTRMTGASKNTIVKLLADVGDACLEYQDKTMHAISLHYMYYNFARPHQTLKGQTPATAAGIADHVWSMEEIACLTDSN